MISINRVFIDNQYESYIILKDLICDMYGILVKIIQIIYANGR